MWQQLNKIEYTLLEFIPLLEHGTGRGILFVNEIEVLS